MRIRRTETINKYLNFLMSIYRNKIHDYINVKAMSREAKISATIDVHLRKLNLIDKKGHWIGEEPTNDLVVKILDYQSNYTKRHKLFSNNGRKTKSSIDDVRGEKPTTEKYTLALFQLREIFKDFNPSSLTKEVKSLELPTSFGKALIDLSIIINTVDGYKWNKDLTPNFEMVDNIKSWLNTERTVKYTRSSQTVFPLMLDELVKINKNLEGILALWIK